ncbi:MAG: alpha-amylase [Ignisphaera sp.]|uniref:Alpha-amylase n=1 Tax=Ignisphaera aggregans TaxID=334771 RepID=A0A7C4JLB6_9CREN
MKDVVIFFEVHQPYRLDRKMYEKLIRRALRGSIEDVRQFEDIIFDQDLNRIVMERAANKCYIPTTSILIENIKKFADSDRKFMVSFGVSGVFIEQALRWAPKVVELFQELVATDCVELVAQTYYHSITPLIPGYRELKEQVEEHVKLLQEVFGVKPTAVENTEFMYNNNIACELYSMGFKVILTEGIDWVLGWRSPNFVYRSYLCDIKVLTRNYKLSDDVGFRFSNITWDQYPLTANKYASWLASTPGETILIAMDYETFGEHHWPETGIHDFLRWLPSEVLRYPYMRFSTPSKVVSEHPAVDIYDVPPWSTISWADERDVSAWLGNSLQKSAFNMLLELKRYVDALEDPVLLRLWKLLTISDHFYYMATKFGSFEEVHKYFSPYKNAVDAYTLYVQALTVLFYIAAEKARQNPSKIVRNLVVPIDRGFHFKCPHNEIPTLTATSIKELLWILKIIPEDCLQYHLIRGDIQKWLSEVFFLEELAQEIDEIAKLNNTIDEKRILIVKAIERYSA